jgi:hypothetical protein
MNIAAPKIRALQVDPPQKVPILITFQQFTETISINKTTYVVSLGK